MNEPRDLVQRLEEKPLLPKGDGELLSGYGVMSCPFARAISSVAGASRPLRSVRPTPPSGMAIRTATGTSTGRVPNGQRFIANPLLIWTVPSANAVIDGRNFDAVAPLQEHPKLGDFWIPRLFAIGRSFFDAFDPDIHSAATTRTECAATDS